MKRTYRNDMPQQQKDKIAAANKGKTLSQHTRELIAQAMRDYWATLPLKPTNEQPNTTGSTPTQPPLPRSPYTDD
jgi:hypothetical protein